MTWQQFTDWLFHKVRAIEQVILDVWCGKK